MMHAAKACVHDETVLLLCNRTSSTQPVLDAFQNGAWGAGDTGSEGSAAAPDCFVDCSG